MEVTQSARKALTSGLMLAMILGSLFAVTLGGFPSKASAAGCTSGSLIKGAVLPAVYYCGQDGKRYVFTNDKAYFTWYSNFSNVITLSDADLAGIQIGGNVTYRPGMKMLKIQSDPRTYAVSKGGILRWVKTEALAVCIFGSNWNQQIDDVSDAFFVNYTVGFEITTCADYNRTGEMNASTTINADKSLTSPVPPPPAGTPTVTASSPVSNATNVAINAPISVTFSEAMNAATINTGTYTLTQGSTNVAGTVTYSGNTATFYPNANLAANTAYTARVSTGARDTNGNSLASDYTFNFTTGASVSGAPSVTSVSPLNLATNVSLDANASATFSEAMNASTLNTSTFTLMKGSTSVSGTVSMSGNTATFNPNANLDVNAIYTATVGVGAKDMDGNALASGAYTWTFTTGTNVSGSPTVLSVLPAANATGVSHTASVSATFSEPMNASTINTGTFTLSSSTTSVAGTVNYSGNTATFFPTVSLVGSATYTAMITTGARDTEGNALASGAYSWSFMTAP